MDSPTPSEEIEKSEISSSVALTMPTGNSQTKHDKARMQRKRRIARVQTLFSLHDLHCLLPVAELTVSDAAVVSGVGFQALREGLGLRQNPAGFLA